MKIICLCMFNSSRVLLLLWARVLLVCHGCTPLIRLIILFLAYVFHKQKHSDGVTLHKEVTLKNDGATPTKAGLVFVSQLNMVFVHVFNTQNGMVKY